MLSNILKRTVEESNWRILSVVSEITRDVKAASRIFVGVDMVDVRVVQHYNSHCLGK